jgi:hypothetical protein
VKCIEKVPTFDCMKWDGEVGSGSHGWFKKRFSSAAVFGGTAELSVSWWNGKVFADFYVPRGHWMAINELTGEPQVLAPRAFRERFEAVGGGSVGE